MESIEIIQANLDITLHSQAVTDLINAYASDPMGNGSPLPSDVVKKLIPGLKKHPTTIVLLAFADSKAAGILTAFIGFSTFQAKPLLNISDFYVQPTHRGLRIGRKLMEAAVTKAKTLDCCKITLEAQENNKKAIRFYTAAGFERDIHTKEAGPALFFAKKIEET